MDLIEILWKQDVDLGFSLEMPESKSDKPGSADVQHSVSDPTTSVAVDDDDDDIEKLKTLKAINDDNIKVSTWNIWFNLIDDKYFIEKEEPENASEALDPWAGLNYTVDTETG